MHVALLMGTIVAIVGVGHLAAWLGGYMVQRGLIAITMKTNAALCLTLAGVALLLLVGEHAGSVRRWTARVYAGLAVLVGLLTFIEHLSGWDFGIDQLLAVETPGALAVVNPNRMGMPASLSFTLAGLALLIFSRRNRGGVRAAQTLALVVCVIGLLPTIGFLYGAEQFYGIAKYTGIAWPTAVTLLLLGLGLLCLRPTEGFMAQVTANDPGGPSIRRLLPAFMILPVLLGFLRLAGERAGVFDAPMGTGMMMITFILLFTGLAYHAGRRVSRSTEVLRESEERFRSLAENLPSVLIRYDRQFRVVYLSPQSDRYMSLRAEQFLGKTNREAGMPEELCVLWEDALDQVFRTGENRDLEFDYQSPQGPTTFLLRFAPEKAADGTVQYVLGISTDISEQKRAQDTLRKWNETLENRIAQRTKELRHRTTQLQRLSLELSLAEERERRRVAVILHEDLQQQIAGARFHLNRLRGRTPDGPPQTFLDQVDQMLKDAIDTSRNLSRDLSPTVLHMNDLGEALQWLINRVRIQHGLTVHVDIQGDMTLQSEGMAIFLFRAAQEMLLNVVKHAGVKEAAIRVRRIGRYLSLSVVDRGQGFDPHALKETAGLGLLGIRERIELLGGRMKIESGSGRGSRLRIVVPAHLPSPGAGTTEQKAGGLSSISRPSSLDRVPRLLLVDDHEVVRQGLAALLQEMPDVLVLGQAANGREAIQKADELRPDVVIMDVSMPEMSGEEATRQIKARLPDVRVIAFSMYDEPDKIDRMRKAGAEGYVLKVASSEELLAAILGKESQGSFSVTGSGLD